MKKASFEIVTLVVPGFNDDEDEFRRMAGFLAGVSPDIPWHLTAFHPDYKMTDPPATPAATLLRACELGRQAGLKFTYAGNLPGRVGDRENTACSACGATLITRQGFMVTVNHLDAGRCPHCRCEVPGVWPVDSPRRSNGSGMPRPVRLPVRAEIPRADGRGPS